MHSALGTNPALDPQLMNLWVRREAEKERLALRQLERSAICGCTRCKDDDKGEELTYLITKSQAIIDEYGQWICERAEQLTRGVHHGHCIRG